MERERKAQIVREPVEVWGGGKKRFYTKRRKRKCRRRTVGRVERVSKRDQQQLDFFAPPSSAVGETVMFSPPAGRTTSFDASRALDETMP